MHRRDWIRSVASGTIGGVFARPALSDVPDHLWQGYDFGPGPAPADRLNQGPFGIEQDEGWFTVPYAGKLRLASFILPKGIQGRGARLKAEIETKGVRRPVRWSCAEPLEGDGAYKITIKNHNDPDWRKGI